ncbi:hypothetical protein F4780DRAFT_793684 [Xylariomycetidae sp. FL0641]|nr:hypothetical protein F4780DRAFT_793684 [Xylariomycetidae sp. FL0641]
MAPRLPQERPPLDDKENEACIADFRSTFGRLLRDRVDSAEVKRVLEAAAEGRWDIVPRDTFNAFYCCIASCRHAYRWATIPVVKVAQQGKAIDIPAELEEPWEYLQRHFGCASQSGNNTSNLILNFDVTSHHVFKIHTGMPPWITSGEEAFARIFYCVEVLALPVYHDMVLATVAFAREEKSACLFHMTRITSQLRPLLSSYYDRLHHEKIALSVWLSHVQGFFAWGVGHLGVTSQEWEKFDGLSGNQVLLFQALDAFLGLEPWAKQCD